MPPTGATLTFELKVCEGTSETNCSDPDSTNVHVTNVNQPPVADAGPDQTVQEGSPVQLDGTASYDPDVEALTYQWTQFSGPAVTLLDGNTAQPTFVAPPVGPAGATIAFNLTVTDPHTLTGPDSVSIHVSNVNQIPVAHAGPDQTVNENTLVTLNGTDSSDPDLDALSYSWTQIAGPSAALTGGATASPTFTAPNVVGAPVTLTFELTVSDGQATGVPDRADVLVQNLNDLPFCTKAKARPKTLWPPNHRMVKVKIRGISPGTSGPNDDDDVEEDGDNDRKKQDVQITVTRVTQDEPVSGLGEGDMSPRRGPLRQPCVAAGGA